MSAAGVTVPCFSLLPLPYLILPYNININRRRCQVTSGPYGQLYLMAISLSASNSLIEHAYKVEERQAEIIRVHSEGDPHQLLQ